VAEPESKAQIVVNDQNHFHMFELTDLSPKQSIRQNVSVLLSNTCHVVSGESSAKVEVGREKV
jgi:hypothetical protein